MRVTLNLASKPYVELRPLYQRLRVIVAVLAVLALVFWYIQRTEYSRARAVQAQVDAIQGSVALMQREQQQHQAEMREPQNAAVLNQAQFLNNLFLRKGFSWTAVMIDLEHVLPAGVQVLNIDPVVAKDGNVSVRLRVLGPHEKAVDLVRNLERSRRFLTPRLTAESADTSSTSPNGGLQQAALSNRVNFDIVADYNPLPLKSLRRGAKEEGVEAEGISSEAAASDPEPHKAHGAKRRTSKASDIARPNGGQQ